MIEFVRENKQFFNIIIIWVLCGLWTPLNYFVVPLTLLLLLRKRMIEELFLGYFFILLISDSHYFLFDFAKSVKNIYIVLLIIYFLFRTEEFYPLNKLYKMFIPFFLFSLYTILSSAGEPFFIVGFQKTISYFFSFVIVPNYTFKLFREKGPAFLKRLALIGLTILIVGFALKFLAPQIAYISSGRYRGLLGNPNGVGIYSFLLFLFFSVLNDFFPELFSKRERNLMYAAIAISIFMSESRTALFGIIIFYLNRKIFNVNFFLGFISFIVFMMIVYFINLNIETIIVSLGLQNFLRLDTIQDASGRYVAWDFAWKQIQANYFIGKGFSYDEYYMELHSEELSILGHQGGVHNSFLSFWMDQGLIGLLIYLRSLILIFIKASKKTKSAFPILFSIVFTGIFESWLVGSLSAFAFLAMVIFTLISSDKIFSEIDSEADEQKPVQPLLVTDY